MSFANRLAIKIGSYLLPQRTAYRMVRAAFATQGIGWAAPPDGLEGSGEARFLQNYLSPIQSPILFDVGANVGDYAAAALKANPRTVVHCFEPSAAHFARLKDTLAGTAQLNKVGLSDKAEQLPLYKDREVTPLASLNKRDLSHFGVSLSIAESVSLVSGDEYVAQHGIARIDLLKIDVEGWEMSVLKGFKESFGARRIACCQFEFGHAHIERRENFRDFWSFFHGHGLRMGVLKPNGRINPIPQYDEIYEHYYGTNYIAMLDDSKGKR